jgi:hypothetical protein
MDSSRRIGPPLLTITLLEARNKGSIRLTRGLH